MSSPTFVPAGDMERVVYDTDQDGIVDNSETLDGFDSADFASRTASNLTLYVYEDATGDADGSSKANGFTTLQAAIDAIPDVAQNVTVIVCKGSTNYLGQTTTIQKASVKSLTIQGEYYWYANCDANAVAGKIVDSDIDTTGMAVGDRVVCTKYSGTVGASSIDDYFYATITEVGSGYVQTSEETKVPTTGWKYLINQKVFDGDNGSTTHLIYANNTPLTVNGVSFVNHGSTWAHLRKSFVTVLRSIFYDVKGVTSEDTMLTLNRCAFIECQSVGSYTGIIGPWYGSSLYCTNTIIDASDTSNGIGNLYNCQMSVEYSGVFGCTKAVCNPVSSDLAQLTSVYISSTCTYGAYGYNITLVNCTNNAATPVYNLTSGGSIEEWDGQALPSIDDATGGQVLALKSDKSALEFATVSGGTGGGELSNLIINGDFSVAQRGTSFVSDSWRPNSDDSYLLDRWLLLSDGNDIVDVTQITSPFSRSRYALQAEVETANKRFGFCQIIEANTCIPLRGQKVSVSFAAKTATSKVINNVRVAVLEWTSTADTVTSDVVSNWASNLTFAENWAALNTPANLALTTSEQTFKVENLTIGATCNNLAVFVWVDDTDCAVNDILQLGEVQVVRGATAPDFVCSTYDAEYIKCTRRCVGFNTDAQAYGMLGTGMAVATTMGEIGLPLAVTMAHSPTVTEVGNWCARRGAGGLQASTGFDVILGNNKTVGLQISTTGGLTVGDAVSVLANNDTTARIFLEAEL